MDVSPISPTNDPADRWQVVRDLAARKAQAAATADAHGSGSESTGTGPAMPQGSAVRVDRHPGTGAQIVSIVDPGSGRVLSQIPHQKVLDVVVGLIELNERTDGGSNDVHGKR